jgi:hypothetical protein
MHIILALVLFGHGVAHLVGFVAPWRIATLKEMPYKTAILANSVNVGDIGIRVVGLFWLIAALAFAASGIGVLLRTSWWLPVTGCVTAFSLLLCVIGWPDSRIGVFINIAIGALLIVGGGLRWFP